MAVTDKRPRDGVAEYEYDANGGPAFQYEEQEGEMVDVTTQEELEKIDVLVDVKIDGGDWQPARCNCYLWRNGTTEQIDAELASRLGR